MVYKLEDFFKKNEIEGFECWNDMFKAYHDSPFLYRITYKRAPPQDQEYNKGDLYTDANYLSIEAMYEGAEYFLNKYPQYWISRVQHIKKGKNALKKGGTLPVSTDLTEQFISGELKNVEMENQVG